MISIRPEAHWTKPQQIGMNQAHSNRLQSSQRMSNEKEPHGINTKPTTSHWTMKRTIVSKMESTRLNMNQTKSSHIGEARVESMTLNSNRITSVRNKWSQAKVHLLWQTCIESDQIKIGSSRTDNQRPTNQITLNWPETKRIKLNEIWY